jgi:2,3-dihydroxybenzoate decarboxylase
MDEAGIDKAVLALTSPGTQSLFDADEAQRIARNANDFLKGRCEAHPDRFYGMAAIAPLDPEWSAGELRRAKEELGFHGVQVNSHTHGHYLDEERFDPILRACADLDLPLYIHPQGLPDDMIGDMAGAGLDGAVYGFGVETSYHALRLLTTGVFDRYPEPAADARPRLRGAAVLALPHRLHAQGRHPQPALPAPQAAASTTCSTTCAPTCSRPTAGCRSARRSS